MNNHQSDSWAPWGRFWVEDVEPLRAGHLNWPGLLGNTGDLTDPRELGLKTMFSMKSLAKISSNSLTAVNGGSDTKKGYAYFLKHIPYEPCRAGWELLRVSQPSISETLQGKPLLVQIYSGAMTFGIQTCLWRDSREIYRWGRCLISCNLWIGKMRMRNNVFR